MMVLAYFSPSWFFGYDVALELMFAVVTLVVSLFAFRIYRATNDNQIKLFGTAFSLISVSYFIQSIFNFMIVSTLNENVCSFLKIESMEFFDSLGIYFHVLFMTIGLVLLTYMTFKSKKPKILFLLLAISLIAIFLGSNLLYNFFLISSIFLSFLSLHFMSNYLKNKQVKTLLIAIAFLLLLFGSLHFILSVDHSLFYALGHILELLAYILIFTNFYLVRKK